VFKILKKDLIFFKDTILRKKKLIAPNAPQKFLIRALQVKDFLFRNKKLLYFYPCPNKS